MYLLGQQIATHTGIAGGDQTDAVALESSVLLGQVGAIQRIARDNKGLTLGDILNHLVFASDDIQSLVIEDEVGGTDLMTLRQSNDVGAIEFAVIYEYLGQAR